MAIPKKIHYCWFGGAELPDKIQKCIASWNIYCPDYEIIRWDETNYDYGQYRFTKEAYAAKKWAFVSDVARLDVIYHHGGIYLDTDVELIAPLDRFLEDKAFMGFEQGRVVATGLGFGAEPGNPVIKANLEAYQLMSFIKEDGTYNLKACPVVTTACLENMGLIRKDCKQMLTDITIYPSSVFCPRLLADGTAEIKEDTVSVHHYVASWTTEEDRLYAQARIEIYTKYGKIGLSISDGFALLRTRGIKAFLSRLFEKLKRS